MVTKYLEKNKEPTKQRQAHNIKSYSCLMFFHANEHLVWQSHRHGPQDAVSAHKNTLSVNKQKFLLENNLEHKI